MSNVARTEMEDMDWAQVPEYLTNIILLMQIWTIRRRYPNSGSLSPLWLVNLILLRENGLVTSYTLIVILSKYNICIYLTKKIIVI